MKRRILLVDDEVAVLLTLKAVLEISGFEVDTAASAREGKHQLRTQQFDMVITDMRMESDAAGAEVIEAARSASYMPAVALLTAFPLADEDWQSMGADKMLVKPMQTRVLLQQIDKLFESHEARQRNGVPATAKAPEGKQAPPKKSVPKKLPRAASAGRKVLKKKAAAKRVPRKTAAKKAVRAGAKRAAKSSVKRTATKKKMRKK